MTRDNPLRHREQAIEPDLPIVDSHHHLWDDNAHPMATHYSTEELTYDLSGGHRVVGTVYAECSSHYRTDGPDQLRPVGETDWVMSHDFPPGILGSIIGAADLMLGARAGEVLDAHRAVAGDRFAGVRHRTAWDPHPGVANTAIPVAPGTLVQPEFIDGVRELGKRGMTFDAWMYFGQLPELVTLARAVPETTIVLNHLGGPLGVGPYASHRADMLEFWRAGIRTLAGLENIVIKIGGLGFPHFIPDDVIARLNGSQEIADYWSDEVRFCIDAFGPERSMCESDFPVDSRLCDYVTLWNVFKLLTSDLAPAERDGVLRGTASRVYSFPSDERPLSD